MKTYIDSDGVLADFIGWVKSINPKAIGDDEAIDRCVIDNYKECFLNSEELHSNSLFLDLVTTNPDYYVLTCVGNWKRYHEYYPEKTEEEMMEIFDVLKENKYKWFEKRGVPRDKVIIVNRSSEKLNYCQPGDVLYDDFRKTVDEWNELGGLGVFVYNNYRD